MLNKTLNSVVTLNREFKLRQADSISVSGIILITETNIAYFDSLFESEIIEVVSNGQPEEIKNIFIKDISTFINNEVHVEIRTGHVNCYFETIIDFINGNKFTLKNSLFYIAENDYYSSDNLVVNHTITNYNKNIQLIEFLKSLSHSSNLTGNQLEYYFYRVSNSMIKIDVKYDVNDLQLFRELEGIDELSNEFSNPIINKDKKELFINELINFVESSSSDYLNIVKHWITILNNFDKSQKLYLAGFSFEKIKASSNEHFQKLLDRIYDSISKVSGYIFGIPIGFILLLNFFDYTGLLLFKNFIILLISILFFILIWFILLQNIKESIDAIENDIDDFIILISSNVALKPIKDKLQYLKEISVLKQKNKLTLVKIVSFLIFTITVLAYLFIFIDKSLFLM
jgi:uncharacterized protein YlzI (FlbEa/FlbD family)